MHSFATGPSRNFTPGCWKSRGSFTSNSRGSSVASDEPSPWFLLAKGRFGLGKILALLGRQEEATREQEAAIDILRKLVSANASLPHYQDYLAASLMALGHARDQTRDYQGAAAWYREAAAIFATLAAAEPSVLLHQNGLAWTHSNLGVLLRRTGDHSGALEAHRRAVGIFSRLVGAEPDLADHLEGLDKSFTELGRTQWETGDRTGATESYQHAIAAERGSSRGIPTSEATRIFWSGTTPTSRLRGVRQETGPWLESLSRGRRDRHQARQQGARRPRLSGPAGGEPHQSRLRAEGSR